MKMEVIQFDNTIDLIYWLITIDDWIVYETWIDAAADDDDNATVLPIDSTDVVGGGITVKSNILKAVM